MTPCPPPVLRPGTPRPDDEWESFQAEWVAVQHGFVRQELALGYSHDEIRAMHEVSLVGYLADATGTVDPGMRDWARQYVDWMRELTTWCLSTPLPTEN